jgi:predicted double-glycine peptidase
MHESFLKYIMKNNSFQILNDRNRTKKIFPFLMIIFLTASCILINPIPVSSIPEEIILNVPYHQQDNNYYCGPACVEMALEYLTGDIIPQKTLADQLKTDPQKLVTWTNNMPTPFTNFGYPDTRENQYSDKEELNTRSSEGLLSIILIWFDTDHQYGHYVVVIGYNATGIFVHDPWSIDWGQPQTRKTGQNAYISYALLSDLWTNYYQWILKVQVSWEERAQSKMSSAAEKIDSIQDVEGPDSKILLEQAELSYSRAEESFGLASEAGYEAAYSEASDALSFAIQAEEAEANYWHETASNAISSVEERINQLGTPEGLEAMTLLGQAYSTLTDAVNAFNAGNDKGAAQSALSALSIVDQAEAAQAEAAQASYLISGSMRVAVKNSEDIPVGGVDITSFNQPSGQPALDGVTGVDGSIIFKDIKPGTYTIKASKEGYLPTPLTVEVVAYSLAQARITLRAQAPTRGDLSVTVRDTSGNPVTGVSVSSTVQPSGQTALSGTTGVDGVVAFNGVLPGSYTLQASKTGYVSKSEQLNVAAGTVNSVSVTLQAQPSTPGGGIPGFPYAALAMGVLVSTILMRLRASKNSLRVRSAKL